MKSFITVLLIWPVILGYALAQDKDDITSKIDGWVEGHMQMGLSQETLNRADSVFKSRQYEESADIYRKAFKIAEDENNIDVQTEALAQIARVFLINNDLENGRIWLEKAASLADSTMPLGWSRYMGVKGRLLWQEDKKPEATRLFMEQYEYCSHHKLHERAIDAAHMVAITGDHRQQIEWGHKGIKEAEEGGITSWLGPLWNNLGATYEDMGKYDSSLQAYLKAREYHYLTGTDANKMIADWAVGHAYLNLQDYKNAREWLEPLIEWCQNLEENEFLGLTYLDLGEIDFAEDKFDTALDKFEQAETLLKEAGMPEWDPDGFEKIVSRIVDCKKHSADD